MDNIYNKELLKKNSMFKGITIILVIGIFFLLLTGCSTRGGNISGTNNNQTTSQNNDINIPSSCH